MEDETPLTEAQARQRRQEALRALAAQQQQGPLGRSDAPPASSATPTTSSHAGQTTAPANSAGTHGPPTAAAAARAALRAGATGGKRRWSALVAAILIIGVVAAGALFWLRRPVASPVRRAPASVAISLDGVTQCPQEATWSPSDSLVAVLGYQQCGAHGGFASIARRTLASGAVSRTTNLLGELILPGSGNLVSTGGMVLLYDTTSGRLAKTVQLDPSILATVVPTSVRNDPVAMSTVGFSYYSLAWSPNGKQLAVSYDVYQQSASGPGNETVYGTGLALLEPASAGVMLLPRQPPTPLYGEESSSFHPQPALLWDLRAGTSALVHVPQALSYRWQTVGTLAPVVALAATPDAPPPAAPVGAVGNPIGGAQFSAWQSGYVSYGDLCVQSLNSVDGPVSCCPITSFYQADFTFPLAWSPDGRYVLQGIGSDIGAFGKIAATLAPSSRPLSAGCPDTTLGPTLAQLPVRDKALTTVLESLSPPPKTPFDGPAPESGPTSANIAWSPNGKRLAVMLQGAVAAQPTAPVIAVYDCATGKVLTIFSARQILTRAQVPLNVLDNLDSVGIQSFAWSPDGQRLMVLGASQPFIVLLGPTLLGT